jgi:hypothetical protein
MKILKRSKEQRQNEVKTIIKKLNELHLNTRYDGIKLLFQNMKDYCDITNINNNDTEEPILINIPCPELNIRITGVLEIDLRKKVWVKLECLEKPIEE